MKISWEHWNTKELEEGNEKENSEDFYDDGYKDDKSDIQYLQNSLKMIHTPFGIVPKTSKLKPSDRWDCWIGYTDKDITNSIGRKISKIPGVESLSVMGRYTFCIGIGKLFEFSSVRREIENELRK